MCWTGKRFFERMPRIALRDIEVYKVLTKEGKSPYQDYQYDFNKETKQVYLKTLKRVNGAIDIYEGYHSYSKKCRFVKSFYDNSSVNYSNLLQFTFFSCFNLPLLFRGGNSALSSIVGQSASVYSGELNPIILSPSSNMFNAAL